MTIRDIITSYVQHPYTFSFNRANCSVSVRNADLFSYSTCICQCIGGVFFATTQKYSPTTSRHQTYLRRTLDQAKAEQIWQDQLF